MLQRLLRKLSKVFLKRLSKFYLLGLFFLLSKVKCFLEIKEIGIKKKFFVFMKTLDYETICIMKLFAFMNIFVMIFIRFLVLKNEGKSWKHLHY